MLKLFGKSRIQTNKYVTLVISKLFNNLDRYSFYYTCIIILLYILIIIEYLYNRALYIININFSIIRTSNKGLLAYIMLFLTQVARLKI